MPLPYFYQPTIAASGSFILNEETSKHCIQVLRMKAGEPLQLTDGRGNIYKAIIKKEDKRHCEVLIEASSFKSQGERKVCIGISLLKNASRFEWFLEKAIEMGVAEIIPLICNRTERQHFRQERMQQIVIAAMLQSQQVWLPALLQPVEVMKVIASSNQALRLIAHCEAGEKKTIKSLTAGNTIQILIGPEGDFTPQEIEFSLQHHYIGTTLGNTRLRTETAGVVSAALLVNS